MASLVVLYEDPGMLVVNKPGGMHTAPLRPGEAGTLLGMVIDAYPEVASVPGVKDIEPGLIHRLDRETSGAVVLARTPAAFAALRASFQSGGVRKGYCAVCGCPGRPAVRTLSIESRFAPFGPGRRMVRVVPADQGAANGVYRTDAEVTGVGGGHALVYAIITRGFRHQVRAHLAFLGFPIVGDALYGSPAPQRREKRMYLHAARIELPHPVTGQPFVVESAVPPSFAALLEEGHDELS